jgi:hypothetical protein
MPSKAILFFKFLKAFSMSPLTSTSRGLVIKITSFLKILYQRQYLTALNICQYKSIKPSRIGSIFPENSIFLANRFFEDYNMLVSGTGCNMTTAASHAPPQTRHILVAFDRRYDDQAESLRHLNVAWHRSGTNSNARGGAN